MDLVGCWGGRGERRTIIGVDQVIVVVVEVDGGDVLVVAAAGGHDGPRGGLSVVDLSREWWVELSQLLSAGRTVARWPQSVVFVVAVVVVVLLPRRGVPCRLRSGAPGDCSQVTVASCRDCVALRS